jgi:hypothetical protein
MINVRHGPVLLLLPLLLLLLISCPHRVVPYHAGSLPLVLDAHAYAISPFATEKSIENARDERSSVIRRVARWVSH